MKRFLFCLLISLVCSCSKFEESDIPYAPVYLELDLRFGDKDLVAYTITNPSLKPVLPEKRRAFPVFWLYAESTITEMRPTMHLICAVPTKPKRISS